MKKQSFWQKHQLHLETLAVFILSASVRLTSLNVFRAVDEEDRWAWAIDFYRALLAGDLRATLVGDGYPGIFPVWLETIWLFLASLYRSVLQGGWIGDDGVYLLIHQWARIENLGLQRFPIVLANTVLVVLIFLYLRRLFGQRIALLAAIFISLDPFILSDSRVNRAEAMVTGLMFLSLLALIAALRNHQSAPNSNKRNPQSAIRNSQSAIRNPQFAIRNPQSAIRNSQFAIRNSQYFFSASSAFHANKHLLLSALFGGLAWLTKLQALVLIPMFAVIILIWFLRIETGRPAALRRWMAVMTIWVLGATATFILLWPATWAAPGPTFSLMFNFATRKVGQEGVKLFFLGQTVLDDDPGLLFYPVIFVLRSTPLMLLGLLLGVYLLFLHVKKQLSISPSPHLPISPSPHLLNSFLDNAGIWALLAYTLLYVGGMSLGSHKQDRFLMAVFPALNVLAAVAFVQLAARRRWPARRVWAAGGVLLALQLATALPYHPYYFSYFNPLVGGGPTATRLTRIGWGEGMDQVGAYLQSLENGDSLVVASRFSHYLLGFKGQTLNLDSDGEWVRADKIVFYIQQSQRMLDPSPGVIRYFQQHVPPEKVVTINQIDYAKVYPNPVQFPADPQIDRIEQEMRLFGYRWETEAGPAVRLIWENLSDRPRPIGLRLWATKNSHSHWLTCPPAPGFEASAQTPGQVVESICPLPDVDMPPGLYDLQVGLQQPDSSWQALKFAAGWSAVELTAGGALRRVDRDVAFARLAAEAVPASATKLEHTYFDMVRLLAYELSPQHLQPGDTLSVTLYWQARRVLEQDADVSLQGFVGDRRVAMANGSPLGGHSTRPTSSWQPGEVIRDVWELDIPADTPAPALLRLDISLFLPDTLRPLPVRNLAGEDIPAAIAQVRLEPAPWPTYRGEHPLKFTFDQTIELVGYESQNNNDNALEVTLYWRAAAPPNGPYTAFLHLLNGEGALVAQSDVPPANGLFPTSVWQPGDVVLSRHRLALPADIPPGSYALLAGMYHPANGTRLPVSNTKNETLPNNAAPIGKITLP